MAYARKIEETNESFRTGLEFIVIKDKGGKFPTPEAEWVWHNILGLCDCTEEENGG